MPIGDFNVGKDVTVDVITAAGPLRATIRTGFSSKQDTSPLTVKGSDGINRHAEVPEGWSGSLDYERADSRLDDYFAQLEEAYYSGLNTRAISITETIREVNGAVSQYRYTGVVMKLDDAGSKMSDQTIKQKVSWRAARRIKVT
jgi:hypothetical protein